MQIRLDRKRAFIASAMLVCASFTAQASLAQTAAPPAQASSQRSARTVFTRALPALDGNKLSAEVVEVTYGPGAASSPHSHSCPVIGYVLEGSVRMQVKGEAEAIYKPGDTFYEAPNGVHLVSANASQTQPAKFLAFLVCDHEGPRSTPVKEEQK